MTTIFLTNKLQLLIGTNRLGTASEFTPCLLGDWNAHVFFVERKKNLIFVNNISYYCVLMDNIRKAELDTIESLFVRRLLDQLVYDEILDLAWYQRIVLVIQSFALASTNNYIKTIGRMNDFISAYKLDRSPEYKSDRSLEELNHNKNTIPTSSGRDEYGVYAHPIRDMKRMIDALS